MNPPDSYRDNLLNRVNLVPFLFVFLFLFVLEGTAQDSLKAFIVKSDMEEISSKSEVFVAEGHQLATIASRLPGMTMQRTGSNTAKPVSHGMTGLRLQVMQDGMRIYGQPWGQDHAPELGMHGARSLKVIRGVDVFTVNSGAVGGLIDVNYDVVDTTNFQGEISIYGGSNPVGGGGELFLRGKVAKESPVYWTVSGGGARHGAAWAPAYILDNTGYGTYNGRLAIDGRGEKTVWQLAISRFYNRSGIILASATEDSTELAEILETGRPHEFEGFSWDIEGPSSEVVHDAFRFKGTRQTGRSGLLIWDLNGHNDIRREWEGHAHGEDEDEEGEDEDPAHEIQLNTLSLDLRYKHAGSLDWEVGAMLVSLQNAFDYEPLIPGYIETKTGGYFKAGKQFGSGSKILSVDGIVRADLSLLEQTDSLWMAESSALNRTGISGGLQLKYDNLSPIDYMLFLGRFWRPAAANELFSQGTHFGAASIELGTPSLDDEVGYKAQFDARYTKGKLQVLASGYFSYFSNFIYLFPNGIATTEEGSFQSYKYFNSSAYVAGGDIRLKYDQRNFTIEAGGGVSIGEDLDQNIPIWNIPAANFMAKGTYLYSLTSKSLLVTSIGVRGEVKKQQWPEEFVLSSPPSTYALLDASVRWSLSERFNVEFTAQNILDTEWRSYLDRLRYFAAMPGRNFVISLSYAF